MRRHYIVLGAQTTVNGVVVGASGVTTIEGKPVAVEGGPICCKSCHSTGYIVCDGPHYNADFFGKKAALENDICACKCSPQPRLLANQSLAYQEYEGQAAGWTARGGFPVTATATASAASSAAATSPQASTKSPTQFDEQFQLVDVDTGELRRLRAPVLWRVCALRRRRWADPPTKALQQLFDRWGATA